MIYFYDGTKNAFLTALLLSFSDDEAILTSTSSQLAIGQKCVYVKPDVQRAKKAEARLGTIDKNCLEDLDILLRSGDEDRDMVALNYFKLLAARGESIRKMLSEDAVIAAEECIQRVRLEVHRMKGFLRFMECESGALYAPVTPDHDIVDLLVPHFRSRLKGYPFAIHDVKRKKAAVYDGENTFLAPLERAEIALSANERAWQSLWKKYYASVNIPSRERLKQMRGYMPVRYWKFLPEKFSDQN